MEYLESIFTNQFFNAKSLNSVIAVLLLLFLRSIVMRLILRTSVARDEKRRWVIMVRNWFTILLALTLLIIWSTEIQTFAISLAALAVAIAVALKELIMCFTGGLMLSFQQTFKVGDRIEIGGVRGDVIDSNIFMTRMLEIGPHDLTHQYTGRAITIPNSLFLGEKTINESFMHKYVLHVFVVPLTRDEDWKRAEEIMLASARQECAAFQQGAKKNMEKLARSEGLEEPSVEPRVRFHLSPNNGMEMIVRIPAPATQKGNVEQRILRRFMNEFLVHEKK